MIKMLFMFISIALISIGTSFARPLSYVQNGAYCYYHDMRRGLKTEYLRGFLVYHVDEGKSLVLMNVIDLETKERYKFSALVTESDDGSLIILNAGGLEDLPSQNKNEIMQSIPDLLNFDSMYRTNSSKIGFDSILEDRWEEFDYSLYYHFSKILPVFKFDYVCFERPNGALQLVAEKFGVLDIQQIDAFYYRPAELFEEKERPAKNEIPEAKHKNVELKDCKIVLDENWKETSVNLSGIENTGMWLQVESFRDAQIMIEELPPAIPFKTDKEKEALIPYFLLGAPNVIPYTVKCRKEKKKYILEFCNYDDENNWITYNRMIMEKNKIVNFSSFLEMYTNNIEYFEKILNGISIK